MKKLLSIITAVSIAASMLSTIIVSAEDKITADEVREMIYASGLSAHPEFWDKIIDEQGKENDVLNKETRKVKDVIDVNTSYNVFSVRSMIEKKEEGEGYRHVPYYDENGKYPIFYGDKAGDDDYYFDIYGFDKDAKRVSMMILPDYHNVEDDAGKAYYYSAANTIQEFEEPIAFYEDYEKIAESINNSDIKDIAVIRVMSLLANGFGVYVRDKEGNEYAISAETRTDTHARELGREVKTLTRGKVMDFKEWYDTVLAFENNAHDEERSQMKFDRYGEYKNGSGIRDTDTRAAYIGTESKFTDVSGDLVSYVNELVDLGIVNGYDDDTFRPENTITRGEAAAMIARMFRYSGKYNGEFLDVSKGDWYADDIAALVGNKIINGYDDTTFAPQNDIKYQEMMKILVFALGHGVGISSYPEETNETAMRIGLTKGLESFDTTAPITRGNMAIMLSNALDAHLFTEVGEGVNEKFGNTWTVAEEDITLIDYLNGGRLNGKFPPTMD